MFDLDSWQEILNTIKKNRLRTFLTGFSVTWGIFMLMILLGAGTGLENAAIKSFNRAAVNSIWLIPFSTSKSYEGHKPGRRIEFNDQTAIDLVKNNKEIEHITSRFLFRFDSYVKYKQKVSEFELKSARETGVYLEQMDILHGRFINKNDLKEGRKVAVLGKKPYEYFFEDKSPVGEVIVVSNIAFTVIGVFEDRSSSNNERIYIPTTTAQRLFNGVNRISEIGMTIEDISVKDNEALKQRFREQMGAAFKFDPTDKRALYIHDNFGNFKKMKSVFKGIRIFIWIIGILSLIAALVGITNIMFITVKERTKEIGVRKAIGATPRSIVTMIISEAVVITAFFGYIGVFLGTLVIEVAGNKIPDDANFMHNPEMDIKSALLATLFLIVAGSIAGFIPARKAANIKPIVALRDE